MKTISIFLALINAITAGILLLFTLSSREIPHLQVIWLLAKVAAAIIVIVIGALTWLAGARAARSGLLPVSSLFLVALGAGTIVWTFHSMEYFMLWYGASLLAQGAASLLGFGGESKTAIAP